MNYYYIASCKPRLNPTQAIPVTISFDSPMPYGHFVVDYLNRSARGGGGGGFIRAYIIAIVLSFYAIFFEPVGIRWAAHACPGPGGGGGGGAKRHDD